jgi:hypothetical protein
MILACTCKHDYQDQTYGPGLRVHNPYRTPAPGGWRCTVCSKVKPSTAKVEPTKAAK